jgi:hypothetical protein
MNLEDLFFDSSRRTVDMAVNTIGDNPEIFKRILDFALEDRERFAMRAARAIQMSVAKHPEIVKPYLKDIIRQMDKFKTGGLKRSFAKMISETDWDFDEDTLGILAEICFKWVNDSNEEIAIKIYAQDILYRVSEIYPELKHELITVMEHNYPHSSVAIKSRSRKMIKKLRKEIGE